MALYPDNITKDQETILYRLYTLEQKLKDVIEYQSKINAIIHLHSDYNAFADNWRKIEYSKSLLSSTILMIKNEF